MKSHRVDSAHVSNHVHGRDPMFSSEGANAPRSDIN